MRQALVFLLGASAAAAEVAVTPATVRGWAGHELGNGVITAGVVPSLGGRVMGFRLGDHEYMWVDQTLAGKAIAVDYTRENPQCWAGGARTWLAPQERWTVDGTAWPPAPTLDYGPWTAEPLIVAGGAGLTTASAVEPDRRWNAAGMRLERRLRLLPGTSRLAVEHVLINASDRHQAWAPWSNVQLAASWGSTWVWFPVRQVGRYAPNGFMWYGDPGWAVGQARPCPGEGIAGVQYLNREGKLGADAPLGWTCLVDRGWAFARRFVIDAKKPYAENGNTVAVYTSGTGSMLEFEAMGPISEMPPGAQAVFSETWAAARVGDGPVRGVVEAGVVLRPLTAGVGGDAGRVVGSFGVFDRGEVVLRLHSANVPDRELWRSAVSPLAALELDVRAEFTGDSLSLVVLAGGQTRELDRQDLPTWVRR